jgi:cytochrome c553
MRDVPRSRSSRDCQRVLPTHCGKPAEHLPALVPAGAPLRNIAPCISCHGSVDQKLGAPWLEGMPRQYLFDQLMNFRAGIRGNDSHAQMRNMARTMTTPEVAEVAEYYAKGALPVAGR